MTARGMPRGRILDDFARAHAHVRVVHVSELPAGWLGKPHALQKAYETSSGEWLLFTDADVRFAADSLRRAVAIVRSREADHLTLFGDVVMVGFWETVLLTFFGLAMHVGNESHRVSDPNSRAYIGVGAFQLIRRSAYEACGTHRRLAMEVVDDMKLGKMVKLGGFRSCIGVAEKYVSMRWHSGVGNVIRGVTKNFFAALGYNVPFVVAALCGMLVTNVAPFVRGLCRRRMGTWAGGGGGCVGAWLSRGSRSGDEGLAAVRLDASDRGDLVLLHAGEIDGDHVVAGRSGVARDVLSVGGAAKGRGLAVSESGDSLLRCESVPPSTVRSGGRGCLWRWLSAVRNRWRRGRRGRVV